MNERVVMVLDAAITGGDIIPRCEQRYDNDPFGTWIASHLNADMFSFFQGETGSFIDGEQYNFSITNSLDFASTSQSFASKNNDSTTTVALLVSTTVLAPDLGGLVIFQASVEFTQAGTLIPKWKSQFVDLNPSSPSGEVAHIIPIFLSHVCLLMEFYKCSGCRCPGCRCMCSIWICLHMVLPILFLVLFAVYTMKFNANPLVFGDGYVLDSTSMEDCYSMALLQYVWKGLALGCIMLCNILLAKYFLMYFPQTEQLTIMVRKVFRQLMVVLMFLFCFQVMFSLWFYSMFSNYVSGFRNILATYLTTMEMVLGTYGSWQHDVQNTLLLRVILVSLFVILSLILRNLPIAVMLSHKQELDLRSNYTYHPFWLEKKSSVVSSGSDQEPEFNPATVGWDFSGKEAKEVESESL